MRIVFDTSAIAKRYIEEPGSEAVELLLQQASELGLCILCAPEIISALNRRRREGTLTTTQYRQIKAGLSADIADATILNVTPAVVKEATRLLEQNVLSVSAVASAVGFSESRTFSHFFKQRTGVSPSQQSSRK